MPYKLNTKLISGHILSPVIAAAVCHDSSASTAISNTLMFSRVNTGHNVFLSVKDPKPESGTFM